jgi:tRNA splicing endonuclease
MKKEEPARYASMTNRMAQFRNRIFQRAENKLTTLSSIDTTGWSKSQIENHENYQNLIARQHELMEIVAHDSGASREERDAAFREMREVGRNLRTAAEKERDTLLDRTFSELGFNKSDRKELRETIQTIYSTTEEWGGGHRGRGNGPRRC